MLWVDKHRPASMDALDLHDDITASLRHLIESRDFPHLLFYGPTGGGKKTRVMAMLRAHFGDAVLNLKLDHKSVQVAPSKTIEMATLSSPHHVDINPSDAGGTYDRVVVMQTIREIASTAPITTAAGAAPFKVVVLNEVDKLSRGAQQALRRTMEKYVGTCRLILVCSSASRLIPPLRSRCLGIRVPGHSPAAIEKITRSVCSKESLGDPSPAFVAALVDRAGGNLRRALLLLEASKMSRVSLAGDGRDIPVADWKTYTKEIAEDILSQQTPQKLFEVRGKFYELLAQCIPAEVILRDLVVALLGATTVQPVQRAVVREAATYDHNMKLGSKPIMHLEAFTAAVMMVQKQYLSSR
jgi:replication factor C subunit 3/5